MKFACAAVGVALVGMTAHGHRPERHVVRIEHFEFAPAELAVGVGDTIEWRNADVFRHTSAADSGAWKSAEFDPESAFVFVVRDTGRFGYHCNAHPTMRGVLVVTAKN